ncbi:hypothetical protein PAXRUDRAFT_160799 [Paxillus rubicundulus Ve08.2h10]|uniref:Uncharacterized protein n=1 Tax=Paxillus rubicundulus Ve08.2h10 TaxID=930991 RepID=A0A0D0CVY8_9AGAM|nr:hypothetical protein PAXRUDRAFT_160799 [Paxillus rubicundulus Ve08.2h10]
MPPPLDADEEIVMKTIYQNCSLEDLHTSMKFVAALTSASLDGPHSQLDPPTLEHLRNPPQHVLSLEDYRDLKSAVQLYLRLSHVQSDYEAVKQLSGVSGIMNDMCINTCSTFTGPLSNTEHCPECREPHYNEEILQKSRGKKHIAHKQYPTILIGPQFQAMFRNPQGAKGMRYREEHTQKVFEELAANGGTLQEYTNFFNGSNYLEAVQQGKIGENDIVLMMSVDGAQLYQFKESDCWVAIWVILDCSPDTRYKKKYVLPACIIPGWKKLKNLNSFMFLGFYHLVVIQKEGLKIWDADWNITFVSHPFLALGTADGPGLAYLNGLVGHHGKNSCWLYCGLKG